jgi:hypothetical protein
MISIESGVSWPTLKKVLEQKDVNFNPANSRSQKALEKIKDFNKKHIGIIDFSEQLKYEEVIEKNPIKKSEKSPYQISKGEYREDSASNIKMKLKEKEEVEKHPLPLTKEKKTLYERTETKNDRTWKDVTDNRQGSSENLLKGKIPDEIAAKLIKEEEQIVARMAKLDLAEAHQVYEANIAHFKEKTSFWDFIALAQTKIPEGVIVDIELKHRKY